MLQSLEMLRVIKYGIKSFLDPDAESILSSQRKLLASYHLDNKALQQMLTEDKDISPDDKAYLIHILLSTLNQDFSDPSSNYLRIMPIDPIYGSSVSVRMQESTIVAGDSIVHFPRSALYMVRAVFDLPLVCSKQHTIMTTSLPSHADKVAAVGVNFMPLVTRHPQLYCLCPKSEVRALYEIMCES